MYYRKYFKGAVSASNTTKSIPKRYGTTSKATAYANQTIVLNNAIKETLQDCGINVNFDEDDFQLWVEGLPLSIYFTSATAYSIFSPFNDTAFSIANGANYIPFSGVNYEFYITVKGEPKNLFDVYIGFYSTPGTMNTSYGFSICKAKGIKENVELVGTSKPRSGSMFMFKKIDDGVELVYPGIAVTATMAIGYSITNDVELSEGGKTIPLIQNVFANGFFRIEDCFFGYGGLSEDNFYNIDGDIYYKRDSYSIIKCTTILQ